MELEHLKQTKEEILSALQTDQKLNEMKIQMARLISHIESEQRVSQAHGVSIIALQDEVVGTVKDEGLRTKVKTIGEYLRDRKRQNNVIFACVIGLVGKGLWELLAKVLK